MLLFFSPSSPNCNIILTLHAGRERTRTRDRLRARVQDTPRAYIRAFSGGGNVARFAACARAQKLHRLARARARTFCLDNSGCFLFARRRRRRQLARASPPICRSAFVARTLDCDTKQRRPAEAPRRTTGARGRRRHRRRLTFDDDDCIFNSARPCHDSSRLFG